MEEEQSAKHSHEAVVTVFLWAWVGDETDYWLDDEVSCYGHFFVDWPQGYLNMVQQDRFL